MIIKQRTNDEEAIVSAKYFPQGKATMNVFNPFSNLFSLIKSYSIEFKRCTSLLNLILKEINPYTTEQFITEWEDMVGIPDGCFIRVTSEIRRRQQIIAKLRSDGVQTTGDMEEILAILGFQTRVFPLSIEESTQEAKFTIVVEFTNAVDSTTFPVPFPWPFRGSETQATQCFMRTIVPAHCQVIYRFL